jgi:hypothetical protein
VETINTASSPDSIFKSLLIVPIESKEWKIMWEKLARHRLNRKIENPHIADNYGDTWQYMESHKSIFGYVHLFRHRLHPKTQRPERVTMKSSFGLNIVPNKYTNAK